MTIYVDELCAWPDQPKHGRAAIHFGNGKRSCHLTTDGTIEELHAFAAKIGMKRAWFQDHVLLPHYDLTPGKRDDALDAGAEEMPMREQLRQARKRRESAPMRNVRELRFVDETRAIVRASVAVKSGVATSISVNGTTAALDPPVPVQTGDTLQLSLGSDGATITATNPSSVHRGFSAPAK